ncbi:MAG TPA: YetF domain-containing protein [Kofleriaceae bacterium]|nr:YetF domain-containing protein [Kofleriaceae bacterium]
MLTTIWTGIQHAFGLGADSLTPWQLALRAVLVYVFAIALAKLGEKRFMGKNTAFDMILGIMLGSVLSRAITTSDMSMFMTLAAGAFLVGLHWLFAVGSFYSEWFGALVKGRPRTLIRDGEIDWDNMRRSHISRGDLELALRTAGKLTKPEEVKVASFERSGEISVIPQERSPTARVLEIDVRDGVQTIRIELT